MKRRNIVRLCSFAICLAAALSAAAISQHSESSKYQLRLEAAYRRNLTQLSECLDSIETSLEKSQYAASQEMMGTLSSDLYAECTTAKNSLSALPVSQLDLDGAYKFLSQAADYAKYISTKDEISQSDYDNLALLLTYAKKYADYTEKIVQKCAAGGKITENEVLPQGSSEMKVSSFSLDFTTAENTFENYPTLLYDGPFADAVLNKESAMIKAAERRSRDECRRIAARALGVDENGVVYKNEESGTIPAYVFSYKLCTISVSKNGGYIVYILNESNIRSNSVTEENAINVAKNFLEKIGYSGMKESYYAVYNNVCTINFAYENGGITYYPDLIKVGISLSDGSIYSLEARGYLTNHTERAAPDLSNAAPAKLSPTAEQISAKPCLIPKKDGKEVFCIETRCKNKSTGQEVLIYTNAETGKEEDILLLLYSDSGTLTK